MSGEIKPLSAQDLEPVIAIDSAIAGTSRRGFFEKRLAAALKQPGEYIYVGLHDEGKLVGYALARLVAGEFGQPGARASFDAIGVDPNHQGRGAGKQLLQAFLDKMALTGAEEAWLEVRESNVGAIKLYQALGFNQFDRRINYYPTASGQEDAIIMSYWFEP